MSRYIPADARIYGFHNESEQEAVARSTVSIAGAGGDGFQLGYKLAMMGVGQINIADPEVFEPENSNRVFGATAPNCGRNKAEVFKEMVSALPRDVKINVFSDGVTEDNVDDFMHGADLLIDESELRYLHVGTLLARKALQYNIPELFAMNIAFAGVATSFEPGSPHGFEKMMGVPQGAPLDELADMTVNYSRSIPYIPPYGDYETFVAVVNGAPLPSISQGVDMASAIGSTEAFLHLTSGVSNRRKSPTWSPRLRYMDAYTNKSGTVRFPRAEFYLGVAGLYAKTKLGINPSASYSDADRLRRSADQ